MGRLRFEEQSLIQTGYKQGWKRQIKQMGIDERQLATVGKDDDSKTESSSARHNLCEYTAAMNLLFVQKLLETSVQK